MNGCKLLHIFNLWEAQLMTNLCSMERATSNEEEIKGNINVSPQGMPVEWACFEIEQCAYTLAFQETCQYLSDQQCTHWLEMNCPVVTGEVSKPALNHQGACFPSQAGKCSSAGQLECMLSSSRFSPRWFCSVECCHTSVIFQLFLSCENMWWSLRFLLFQDTRASDN